MGNLTQKGSAAVVLLVVIVIILAGIGGYYFFKKPNPTAGWKTYINSQYGFEFKYPKEWVLADCIQNPTSCRQGISYDLEIGFQKSKGSVQLLPQPSYCEARPSDSPRCETKSYNAISTITDWGNEDISDVVTLIGGNKLGVPVLTLKGPTNSKKTFFRQILSTFKFTK